jgi:hypothetical protein
MNDLLQRDADIVLTGRFEVGEDQVYRHVPFEMPAGVTQFHLKYDYTNRISAEPWISGGNTLDIGLFDQKGHAAGTPGFRGWSGSDKREFTVGRDWATPPYRPGEIEPGTWCVLLGPYKIGPNGLDYRIEIWLNPGLANDRPEPGSIRPQTRAALPTAIEPGWLRGDLHCHTLYSDGDSWPAEVLAAAGQAGLDFLAITDHNSARRPNLPNGRDGLPLLISGTETTTYGGHWNAWGVDRWFEFRDPTHDGTQTAFNDALAAGALVSINHPKPLGPDWSYGDLRGNHAIEIWNGPWGGLNSDSLAYWETRLKRGERYVALGGSDTHNLKTPRHRLMHPELGTPTTWVHVEGEPSQAAILDAIRRGACFVSASPAGPQLIFDRHESGRVRAHTGGAKGATIVLISDRGSETAFAIPFDDWETTVPYPAGVRYLRAQILDATGTMLAVSNPIWPD